MIESLITVKEKAFGVSSASEGKRGTRKGTSALLRRKHGGSSSNSVNRYTHLIEKLYSLLHA